MNKIRKFLLAGAAFATPALCLAEGETATATTFADAVQDLQEGVTGVLGDMVDPIVAIVVAAVAIWAIPFAWRKLRGAAR